MSSDRCAPIVDVQKFAPFDPVNGRARIWYWKAANGEYEFYDNRGFHPRTGEPLAASHAGSSDSATPKSHDIVTTACAMAGRRMCRQLTFWRVREYEKGKPAEAGDQRSAGIFRSCLMVFAGFSRQTAPVRMGFDPQTSLITDADIRWAAQIARRKDEDARRNRPPQPVDPAQISVGEQARCARLVCCLRAGTSSSTGIDVAS